MQEGRDEGGRVKENVEKREQGTSAGVTIFS